MKKELIEYLDNYEGGYNNRHAIRYLSNRCPGLWNRIVEATPFLPNDAKPKQRCWHILNDVWQIPLCPVTGKNIKWHENRYLTYADKSAKYQDPDFWHKMKSTMEERYGVSYALQSPQLLNRAKRTIFKNYGVSNPSKSKEIVKKIKTSRLKNGSYRNPEEIPAMEYYYLQVAQYTEESWKSHYEKINPNRLPRGRNAFHLDHIFSRIDGYKLGVPADIIGHWSNLQMLDHKKNARKNRRSDIDLDTLLERHNNTSNRNK